MYREMRAVCVVLCAAAVVSSTAPNVNGFESTMKFLTGAADPKTPLAMPYFLGEIRQTDGDSTPKSVSPRGAHRNVDAAGGAKRRLVATKARHVSQTFDLSAAPTVHRETADGREYRDASLPSWMIYPNQKKWPQKTDARKPYLGQKSINNSKPWPKTKTKPSWQPNVYKPSNNNHNRNVKARREKVREYEGVDVYNRQRNHFLPKFSEPQVQQVEPVKHKNERHPSSLAKVNQEHDDEDEDDNDEDDEEFVPTRMYAQVRQYESESHLPADAEEPRLRKIVKDSRIHTVYMEEGYEDGAYDHAGEEKYAEEDEAQVEHRRKRRHIDFSITNVEIDTDVGKHEFALGQPYNIAAGKYPYYDQKSINSNSPLRYAQSMDDIPRKKEGKMSFYEDANARTKCEEVVETVEPIPKDLDAGEEAPEKTMLPKLPRLKKLGDKIDCFKIKFFGEEPFDNPLFKEEMVGQPAELTQDPDFKEAVINLKQDNRTGKSFQPIAVEETGFTANEESAAEDNEDAIGDDAESNGEPLPEAEALRMRRVTRRRKRPYHQNKLYSGRYAAYRPSRKSHPTHKLHRGTTPPTIQPSPNVISEVYYKNQIKPSEQLNVFADVINHIQNMSRDDSFTAASEQRPHVIAAAPPSTLKRPAAINTKLQTGHRKKLKRKYPVMKSTQQLYTDYVRRSKNSPSRIQNDISPVAQESNVNVGTVQIKPIAYDSMDYTVFKGNSETPIHYSTIDLPLNKYLVPGMKPPLAVEKPMIYSDYQSDNILKRKDWQSNHRLSRRKRGTRNNYAEIRRQPAHKPQEDAEEDDDTDDYVPHRPTNYHYDPDTDRIVYDKKPTTDRTVEEIIEEYFEEEPEEPEVVTTKKPPVPHKTLFHKDVLNNANGKTLVDYLEALRSDPSYKPIKDPKPTEDSLSTTTLKPVSTTPPEFIKFLEKLHSSDGYKKIENPEDMPSTKKPKTTTTEAPVEEKEEAEEEETVSTGNVQNSPGGQFGPAGGLQIFDINDFLPKVKTYTPRTSIDYSKYKTIERTTSRHSLSSRYSEEDDPVERPHSTEPPAAAASKYQTAPPRPKATPPPEEEEEEEEQMPAVAAVTLKKEEQEEEDEDVKEPSTTSTTTTTTAAPKIRIRGRQRPTKRPTRVTTTTTATHVTTGESVTEAVVKHTPATHRPASRVYQRRQRPKIRLRSTTTPAPKDAEDNDEEPSEAHRRTIRRQNHAVPANHKPDYTPLTISKRMDNHPIMLVSRQARLVTPEIINYNQTRGDSLSRPGEINPRAFAGRYNVARSAQVAPSTAQDKDASLVLINDSVKIDSSSGSASSKDADDGEAAIDRSDIGDVASRVKFIKDPNKRLYFYAPL